MNDYKSKLTGLSERLKSADSTKKLQEVKPVQTPLVKEEEEQLMCWVPKSLMKKLRIKVVEEDSSQKAVIIKLLKGYLEADY